MLYCNCPGLRVHAQLWRGEVVMRAESTVRGSRRWLGAFACLVAGAGIGIAGYFSGIPFDIRVWIRAALCIVFLVLLFPAMTRVDSPWTRLAGLCPPWL